MNYKKWLKLQDEQSLYDFRDKAECTDTLITYMLNRTQKMFEYDGLPETIPAEWVERFLQINGNLYIPKEKFNGNYYAFTGGLGGAPDPYHFPTVYTVANPALNISKEYNIKNDGVLIKDDAYMTGLIPLLKRYASLIVENEISLYISMVNSRAVGIVSASDDGTIASANKYFSDLEAGKLSVVAESAFLDGVRTQAYTGTGAGGILQNLIELEQYLRATLYSEIGLKTNYNMKRESLNADETGMDNDILFPLVDDMLQHRKEGWNAFNKMTGMNVTVRLSSSWMDNKNETAIADNKNTGSGNIGSTREGEENAEAGTDD